MSLDQVYVKRLNQFDIWFLTDSSPRMSRLESIQNRNQVIYENKRHFKHRFEVLSDKAQEQLAAESVNNWLDIQA